MRIPYERYGTGGAVTQLGDTILVLTHEGTIFSARSSANIAFTNIRTPDSGFSKYKSIAESDRYNHLNHAFYFFRYIDIAALEDEEFFGLAISYIEFSAEEECYSTAVALLELETPTQPVEQMDAEPGDWQVIFRTQPCLPLKEQGRAIEGHMAGGRLAFDGARTLYFTSGDYHWDGVYGPKALAQRHDNHYGKVVAIDLVTR